ncbi:MAG: hypothetical protein WA160_16360 [Pseudobdellovibrio sp.]
MSRSILLKSILTISIGAFCGYNTVQYFKTKNSSHRYLASITMSKIASDQYSKTLIDVRIKNIDIAQLENDVSTVKVSLEAFKPLPAGLNYSWILPKNIQIVDGLANGILTEFSANQIQELTLKIKGYSKAKKSYLSFSVSGEIENSAFKREVLLSSRPEDSFEYVVQDYERNKSNELKANSKLGKNEYKSPIDIKKVVH